MNLGTETVRSTIPCNLCGGRDAVIASRLDREREPLQTVICRNCGLVWTDPRPNSDEVKSFYSEKYRLEYKGAYRPKLKHVYRAGQIAVERYKLIADRLRPDCEILDIGASSGEFVYLLRALGYNARGIEPNRGYGEYARDYLGLPIEIGMAGDFELPADSINVATMHHVFEHLEDPLGQLRLLHPALRRGGIVAIEVPNIESRAGAPANRFHLGHLFNFNLATLEAMGRAGEYSVLSSETSPDGGVIRTLLQKAETEERVTSLPGNYERVSATLFGFTARNFYLTANPYKRPFLKLRKNLHEKRFVARASDGRAVLDALIEGAFVNRNSTSSTEK